MDAAGTPAAAPTAAAATPLPPSLPRRSPSTPVPQSTFFNVLSSIRFFKHYLAAKSFRLWRANVRYKLYTQQRSKLCRRLFLAKPAFCSTLLEINALCYELRTGENTRLMAPLSPNTHSSIDAFLEEQVQRSAVHTSPARPPPAAPPSPRSPSLPSPPPHSQAQQRAHAAKAFEQIVDKLQALVEKVCKDVMTRARLSDETLSGAPADGDEGGDGGAKHRSKSMAKMREEQQVRAPPEGKDGRTPHNPPHAPTARRHPTAPLPSFPSGAPGGGAARGGGGRR